MAARSAGAAACQVGSTSVADRVPGASLFRPAQLAATRNWDWPALCEPAIAPPPARQRCFTRGNAGAGLGSAFCGHSLKGRALGSASAFDPASGLQVLAPPSVSVQHARRLPPTMGDRPAFLAWAAGGRIAEFRWPCPAAPQGPWAGRVHTPRGCSDHGAAALRADPAGAATTTIARGRHQRAGFDKEAWWPAVLAIMAS